MQQVLAEPGVLEQLFEDTAKAAQVREVFTGLYSLDLVKSSFSLRIFNFIFENFCIIKFN